MNIVCDCGGSIILNNEPFSTTFIDTEKGGVYNDYVDGHCEKCGKSFVVNKRYDCVSIVKVPVD